MNPLFGTDGIRGRVGAYPLDPSTLFVLGTSLAKSLTGATGHKPRLISARDTRESGPEIEAMLCSGIIAAGGSLVSAGVLPTPAVAFLVEEYGFDGGIVVSASHNPHEDNGIKVFSGAGRKLDDRMEDAIAEEVIRLRESAVPAPRSRPDQDPGLGTAYERHLLTLIRPRLDLVACKLVVDCANGAASRLAPGVLEKLGAQVHAIHDSPNGVNINLACGALHLDGLISEVIARRFDMGVAFDGDADRIQLVGRRGDVYDGDHILYCAAVDFQRQGKLSRDRGGGTVMSNAGLELALNRHGIRLDRAQVGDRFVLEMLLETGASLGGEQSGHVIFPAVSMAGDGMVTLLMVLSVLSRTGADLDSTMQRMQRMPQILINVRVRSKPPLESIPAIDEHRKAIEARIAGRGRLLLRYSGTEDLARVMIEGEDAAEIRALATALGGTISSSLA